MKRVFATTIRQLLIFYASSSLLLARQTAVGLSAAAGKNERQHRSLIEYSMESMTLFTSIV